jgi:hypothetical protein
MTNSKIKLNLDSLKSRKEWKRHKVKDGHNVYRILPPFGDNSNGYPYRKWQVIWGLTDPESGRARPFASSMTSEKRCPVTDFVNCLKDRAETLTAKLAASGASEEDTKARLHGLQELIGNLVPKTVYIYNACDKSGEVGLLELKSTAHQDMKAKMNQYIQDYNQDPTSLSSADDDSGVWFDIVRSNATGKFRDTKYSVEKVQAKVKDASGRLNFVDDRSPLADSVVENYANLGYDLSSIYQVKTYDELSEILQANLPNLIDMVPDADLSVEPSLTLGAPAKAVSAQKTVATATTPAKGAGKVAIKLTDEDDDATGTTTSAGAQSMGKTPAAASTAKTKPAAIAADDDFMAEADAIINS